MNGSSAENNLNKDKQKKIVTLKTIGVPLALTVMFIIFSIPTPEGLSLEGQKAIAIFCSALILWVCGSIPIYLTSMIAIVLLSLTGTVAKEKIAFATLGYDVIWLMISAFVLTAAMMKSNLARRFALWMITEFGQTPKKALFVLIVINFCLVFFVPSTTARAALMVPICLILLEVYKAVPGKSNFGKLMMLQGVQADALATSGVMTGTAANIIAVGFINSQAGGSIGYMDWLVASFPLAVIGMIMAFFVGLKFFSFKGEVDFEGSLEKLKYERSQLGILTLNEKKAIMIFLTAVFLWATESYHEAMFGFSISVYMTAVISAILCLLPRVGLLTWSESNIKWDLMLFAAGAYAVGNALESSKGAEFLIGKLVYGLGLESMSPTTVYILVVFICMYSHIIFTSKTVKTTILIPSIIALAKTLEMDPVTLALAASFTLTYTITLPPHSKVNTIYFSTGYFSVLDQMKYGITTCFIGASIISIAIFTWFKVLGYGF
ncbi:DASS family sodium-coupled anion symporter [Vibrio metschnikovii]|uniref:DASS family sodium-coupled anion symporter n=3 Tax=Unclassified Bacteria TaxID=49928 RepID=A0AAU6TFK7_UNCXX|nr:DASS family sodium-coupled anion symporter [Vibrio metschnikovii]EKO3589598.1 DASS family sodium-coupled anion symporter [Vibrio metschnikovii]EKO3642207.1 DASS family sodium-coupled anion symporter [Vibrio metschnikovii]EKO3657340.1 DASS family sodium-coupled anion symporter [Vibrio metschnikovii]EKO3665456.1 DASS family sodium-coupled anion symporter [Vibrio metschnikovii]